MHRTREGQLPEWFRAEGFEPAVDPDFEDWRIGFHGSPELPGGTGTTARVVCEVRGLPDVRVAVRLSVATGELVALEVGDAAVVQGEDDLAREPKPISARLLREIPFGEIERAARATLKWELAVRYHHDEPVIRASLGDGGQLLRESLANDRRPGRRGRSDAAYASLAAEYVKRLNSATPVTDLAASLNYSVSRVHNMLSEVRRRGLLTRPAPGKAGGQLTPKAIDLLNRSED